MEARRIEACQATTYGAPRSPRSPTTAITISFWANIAGFPQAWSPILCKSDSLSSAQYAVNFTTSWTFNFDYINNPGGCNVVLASPPGFSNWNHYVVIWDGTTVSFFTNGNKVGTAAVTGPLPSNSRPLRIGTDPPGSTEYFKGSIDEIRIYNRSLSDAEVLNLYKQPLGICDRFGSITYAGQQAGLIWVVATNSGQFRSATSLSVPAPLDWTVVGTVTNATGTVEYAEPLPPEATELYYRAKLVP